MKLYPEKMTWNITYDPERIQKLEESHAQLVKSLEWIYAKIAKDPQYFSNEEVYDWYLSACNALTKAQKVSK